MNTGWHSPTATGYLKNEWNDPTNAYSSDNNRAWRTHADLDTNATEQDWTGFGFSLPANAVVLGIEVSIEGYIDTVCQDWFQVNLRFATSGMSDPKFSEEWPSSEETRVLGSPTDLWGREESGYWEARVGIANFGTEIQGYAFHETAIQYIDHVQIKIYYYLKFSQVISSKADIRIAITYGKDIQSRAGISKIEQQDSQSKGNISVITQRDLKTKGNLSVKTFKNLKSKANLEIQECQGIQSKGDIFVKEDRVLLSKANLLRRYFRNLAALADIKFGIRVWNSLENKGYLFLRNLEDLASKANLSSKCYEDLLSRSDIFIRLLINLESKGNLQKKIQRLLETQGNIISLISKDLQSKGYIQINIQKDLLSKANLFAPISGEFWRTLRFDIFINSLEFDIVSKR